MTDNSANQLDCSGIVEVNGEKREYINYRQCMAFVQQEDVLMETMTVYECLTFAAHMKLPPKVNKEQRVEMLLTDLKLRH